MKRPPLIAYLVGNLLSVFLIGAYFLYTAYAAFCTGGSGWLAFGMLLAVSYAGSCYSKLESYDLWKREWDSMSGAPPKRPLIARGSLAQVAAMAILFAVVMLLAIAGAGAHYSGLRTIWLVLGELALAGLFVLRLARHRKSKAKPTKAQVVSVCLAVPYQSIDLSQSYRALPDYCRQLLSDS